MSRTKIRFQTVRDPWMPLMGLWGVISYLPLLVRRQYGSEQFVPVTNGLNSIEFDYKEVEDVRRGVGYAAVWKKKNMVKEGESSEAATMEYEMWHEQRVKDGKLPKVLDPTCPVGDNGRNIVTELTIENRILKYGTKMVKMAKRHEQEKEEWKKQKQTFEDEIQTLQLYLGLEEYNVEHRNKKIKELKGKYAQESKAAASFFVQRESQASEIQRLREKLEFQQAQYSDLEQELKRKTSSTSFKGVDLRRMAELEKDNNGLKATLEDERVRRQNLENEVLKVNQELQRNAGIEKILKKEQAERKMLQNELVRLNR